MVDAKHSDGDKEEPHHKKEPPSDVDIAGFSRLLIIRQSMCCVKSAPGQHDSHIARHSRQRDTTSQVDGQADEEGEAIGDEERVHHARRMGTRPRVRR